MKTKKEKKEKTSTSASGMLKRRGADRHLLYEWAVQNPGFEIHFINHAFRKHRHRRPLTLREDFCGTSLLCANWVESRRDRFAIGLDLDKDTLDWGRRHNLAKLNSAADRVTLLEQDVRSVTRPKVDVACAYNFSYYLIHPLANLVKYFTCVYESLNQDGLIFMDSYGGWDSQQLMEEPREVDGPAGRFVYIWDQAGYNPIDNMATCYIHFEFANGKMWERAFTYRWRLYSPAEVKDALLAAGFSAVDIYWDRSPDEDENEYRVARRAENTPGWLTYIVGIK